MKKDFVFVVEKAITFHKGVRLDRRVKADGYNLSPSVQCRGGYEELLTICKVFITG